MNKSIDSASDSESLNCPLRLQKLLAAHGLGSRRACEEFILKGRVEVDGQVVNKLGTKVDPNTQRVTVDGERLIVQKLQYFMLNKPPGILSTASDPSGRPRVIDLIKTNSRVYNVGRLDQSSEGLILVTNDGDLANKLTHPRYGIEKKYHVLVVGQPDQEQLAELRKGIYLAEAKVRVSNITIRKRQRDRTWLEIVLDEGRNREIRRILARIGHKVVQLRRVAIGPLALGDLPLGSHRQLTAMEVKLLQKAAAKLGAKDLPKISQPSKYKHDAPASALGGKSINRSSGKSAIPSKFRKPGSTWEKATGTKKSAAKKSGAKKSTSFSSSRTKEQKKKTGTTVADRTARYGKKRSEDSKTSREKFPAKRRPEKISTKKSNRSKHY